MKKIQYLLLLLTLSFCSTIKQLSNQKIAENTGCSTIVLDGKKVLLDMEIDHVKTKFLLDTGAGFSVLVDSTIVKDFQNKEFGSLGSAKGADRKKIKNRFFTVELNCDLFKSESKVLSFINMPTNKCAQGKKSYTGILGIDTFFNEDYIMQLDFTNNKVCNINGQQFQQNLSNNQYQLLKSKCKRNQIFVYLNIEGKEYPFKVDTGYTGNIVMPYDDNLDFKNEKKMELEGSLFQTISSHTNGHEVIYEKMPVVFGSYNLQAKMTVSTSIKAQNIGIDFIKAFDWLIDYNHNKVYIKRNQNPIESNLNRKVSYYAKVNQEKLLIVVKEKSQTKYQLGDEIITVNGQKVSAENQCGLQDLLNKTDDWNTLQLEVVSSLK
ncbi:hypothetical protein [Flavobacterium sp.]|uniref:hypothetical protein n=1 Tax=Flavobacterium sp. TaxID=239 RepID=UPI00286AE77C|nr:hypothetical protein [Flavobacterium sp.]